MGSPRTFLRDSGRLTLVFLILTAAIASTIAALDPRAVRAKLQFGFAHVPHNAGQAVTIIAANLRLLLAFIAMAVIVQAGRACRTPRGRRVFTSFCDFVVAISAVHDLVLPVATSVGAYGWRMVVSMLPAGPVELAAYALAASLYLCSRRAAIEPDELSRPSIGAGLSVLLVVAAAVIETYA